MPSDIFCQYHRFILIYEITLSAFKDDRVTGRPKNLRTIMGAFFSSNSSEEDGERLGSGGIVFSHGAEWREQRRFALRNLRDQVGT